MGALKGFGTKHVIRDAKVKSVSTIGVEAVYTAFNRQQYKFKIACAFESEPVYIHKGQDA
jgi:hypothetical protein